MGPEAPNVPPSRHRPIAALHEASSRFPTRQLGHELVVPIMGVHIGGPEPPPWLQSAQFEQAQPAFVYAPTRPGVSAFCQAVSQHEAQPAFVV